MNKCVLQNISYGVYVISSVKDGKYNGLIGNCVIQITNEPITIAISISKKNLTHDFIMSSGLFTISILDRTAPLKFIGQFGFKSGRDTDKFVGVGYKVLPSGCPLVTDHTLSWISAKVLKNMDCVTHTLFLAEVMDGDTLKNGEPMTYEYYHQEKRGTTPENAPTFIKNSDQKICATGSKYRCLVCNYIYDPLLGDKDSGIEPGIPFEKLPDNWVCPICGVGKDQFVKVD
ncbi:MAG: rubredoxin [Candidatus Omnitrophica bacterium]|nr:rubredoxin [Candidatus Omnitrophota bacterium]